MKKLIAVMAIALMLGQSPFCYAGIPQDKQKHVGVAAGLDLAMAGCGVKKETRWAILGGLIIGKEIYDSRHAGHSAEWGDVAAGVGGVVAAEGVIWIVHTTW